MFYFMLDLYVNYRYKENQGMIKHGQVSAKRQTRGLFS
jgi:hypothetical protein